MSTEAAGRADDPGRADMQLVTAALAGSSQAQDALFVRLKCVPRMLAARNARLGSPLSDRELEELSQDTLCVVWRKLGAFNGSARLETWVFRFCFLELLKRLRDRRRASVSTRSLEDLPAGAEPAVLRTAAPIDFDDVHEGLAQLEPDEADAVRLKHFDGLTLREAGERLGQSENTIKGRYYRGIRKLRDLLVERTKERRGRRTE